MRKTKAILSSVLTFFMVIGLLQNSIFVKEAKAYSKEGEYLIKENARVLASDFYNNKIFLAYTENNEKVIISSIESGKETVLYEDTVYSYGEFLESNVDSNILSLRLSDYDEGFVNCKYLKINIQENKVYVITEDEYNSLYKIEEFTPGERKEWTDSEVEEVLQKINKNSDFNLTILDKKLEPVNEYYSEYVNEDKSERIGIDLNYFENSENIIEFFLKYTNENTNEELFYFGIVYGDYAYIGKENAIYSPAYEMDGENLFIINKNRDNTITEVTKVNKNGLVSKKIINAAYDHEYYEVYEDVLHIYRAVSENSAQLPKMTIYKENANGYDLIKEIQFLGRSYILSDDSDLFLALTNNKLELLKIKGSNIEIVDDISNMVDVNTLGYRGYFSGIEGNFVFDADNGQVVIRQEKTSNPNDGEDVLPPVEENKPNENTVLDIEVPTLKADEVNEIPVVSSKTNKFNIILKDIEALKNGQGSLKLVLNNTTLKLPFSVLDSNLLGENDTVSVKLDVLSDLEITKGLKAVNKVFDFNLVVNKENEGIKVHNFKDGVAEITISLTDKELEGLSRDKLKVYYYNEETKKFEVMETKIEGNNVTFKTSHFSKYIISEEIVDNTVNKPNTDSNNNNNTITSDKNDEVTIKPDIDNLNNSATSNEESTTETGKGNLPNTGAVISTTTVLVLAAGIIAIGGFMFIRRRKHA